MSSLPLIVRRIFVYWNSGFENAPPLVRLCLDSWIRLNPDWELVCLDDSSLDAWVDMSDVRAKNPSIKIQAFADILRWRLLLAWGGAWVDATLLCVRPLSAWLPSQVRSGFFVFRTIEPNLHHNWFLYGTAESSIVHSMNRELDRLWVRFGGLLYYWDLRGAWRFFHFLETHFGGFNRFFWSSRFNLLTFRVYPYFVNMYLMGPALRRSAIARRDFFSLSTSFADSFHDLQSCTAANSMLSILELQSILGGVAPVQKLTTKRFVDQWQNSGVLEYLAAVHSS